MLRVLHFIFSSKLCYTAYSYLYITQQYIACVLCTGCIRTKAGIKLLCCICQDETVNPVELPCSHVFCYLCVKGVAARSGACALCRKPIPPSYLDNPSVVNSDALHSRLLNSSSERYHWFYEGKSGGWWIYEDRTSEEIEKGFLKNAKLVKIQISGFMYIIDYERMVQIREDHPNRKRKIKRDLVSSAEVKGVAGIHIERLKK